MAGQQGFTKDIGIQNGILGNLEERSALAERWSSGGRQRSLQSWSSQPSQSSQPDLLDLPDHPVASAGPPGAALGVSEATFAKTGLQCGKAWTGLGEGGPRRGRSSGTDVFFRRTTASSVSSEGRKHAVLEPRAQTEDPYSCWVQCVLIKSFAFASHDRSFSRFATEVRQ